MRLMCPTDLPALHRVGGGVWHKALVLVSGGGGVLGANKTLRMVIWNQCVEFGRENGGLPPAQKKFKQLFSVIAKFWFPITRAHSPDLTDVGPPMGPFGANTGWGVGGPNIAQIFLGCAI